MNEKEWNKKIFLKKGTLRGKVYQLVEEPKTATELAKELGKHRSAISKVLIELEKEGFVKCINPQDDRYRHYVKKQAN